MTIQIDEIDKIGNAQEAADTEHEQAHSKEPTKEELIEAYIENKKEQEEEKNKKAKEIKDKVIEEPDKYIKR